MSCGPSKELLKMADKIQAGNRAVTDKINSIANGAIGGIQSVIQDAADSVKGALKDAIPEISIPKKPDSLQSQVADLARKAALIGLSAPAIADQLKQMKQTWGNVDLGDLGDIDNLPNLLRTGALDLESLCKKIPNLEKDGVDVVVRGIPVSFPSVDAAGILKTGRMPTITKPNPTVNVNIRKEEAAKRFLNVKVPNLYGIRI